MIITLSGNGQACNCHLILCEHPALIDTGLGDESLIDEIEKHIPIEDIEFVINTHCHFDHIGGNGLFEKSKILAHETDADAISKNRQDIILNGFFGGDVFTKVDVKLKDGDVIDLGDVKLKVIHTPGHTAGSICLLYENESALFTGDTLFDGCCGRTDLPTGDEKSMNSSLKRILKLDFEKAYPGHGKSFTRKQAHETIHSIVS